MVLKNWYNTMKVQMSKGTILQGITNFNGQKQDISYANGSSIVSTLTLLPTDGIKYGTVSSTGHLSYYWLGSSTTPATFDDYKLENLITSGLSCSFTVGIDANNNAVHLFTITNTSDKDITIGENGIVGSYYGVNYSYSTALMERTVLDTPVTIPAGGIGQVTYTICLNYPT